MLSKFTIKYVDLLTKEVELFQWAEKNKPKDFDLHNVIADYVSNTYSIGFTSALVLRNVINSGGYPRDFGNALLNDTYWNYSRMVMEWCQSTNIEKATLFLAKYINELVLKRGKDFYELNEKYRLYGLNQDFESLPLKDIFLKATTKASDTIYKNSISGFMSFDNYRSAYKEQNDNWNDTSNTDKEKFLKWFLLPKAQGDISIQVTPASYTQVGNPNMESDNGRYTSNVDINNDLIYFMDTEAQKSSADSLSFKQNIEPLEKYALQIQNISKYSVIDIPINAMLDRLNTSFLLTKAFTPSGQNMKSSLSYKLVFNIAERQAVVVPCVDMFQSLYYMQSMGTETVSMYYDNLEERIVIRGKDFQQTIERSIIKEGSRFPVIEKEQITIPTFAIIYEQKVDELTPLCPVEYVQFFDKSLNFRDKYDLISTQRNAPIELPEEFVSEYPLIADIYEQQTGVALSLQGRVSKYDYVSKIIENYLASYTELVTNNDGEIIRKSVPTGQWSEPDYVLKVNEAYWLYNSKIKTEELLSFFVSKGNNVGYRILCMKILGIDYHLFEQPIIDSLLQSNDIYVSEINVDEQNISVDIKYQDKNSFVSGNIYNKKKYISQLPKYKSDINTFFGESASSTVYDKAASTVEEAVSSRFTPSIAPVSRTEEEEKTLQLDIDIFCPMFFSGTVMAATGKGANLKEVQGALITGRADNMLNLVWNTYQSKSYDFGHFELFNRWLSSNANLILGEYDFNEIVDAYNYPKPQDLYIMTYIFPFFKDENYTIVGFNYDGGKNLKEAIFNANESTRSVLKRLGKIQDEDIITDAEYEKLKKQFVLDYKTRVWDARREGRRLFNLFLKKGLDDNSRKLVDLLWNETYNNYAFPNLDKVPVFPSHNYYFGKKTENKRFDLMNAQLDGIRHCLSRKNSGLLLHEVGFGKTTSSISIVSSMFNTGEANRVLFLVPNSVYDKFQDEISGNESSFGLLPNVNVVLLDNLREGAVKKIKHFDERELDVIKKFKQFNVGFNKIIASLKRGRITLYGDPLYTVDSNWNMAITVIKEEIKKLISDYEEMEIVANHVKYIEEIYNEVNTQWEDYRGKRQSIIDSYDSVESQKKKAEKEIASESVTYSKLLGKRLKDYVNFVALSLIDDLGYYLPQVMADKTIMIAKHSAIESLRPKKQSVLRALMFKEGLGDPVNEVNSTNPSDWASATGLTESKVKSAMQILTKHPISLERLNVDTLVVDEIHNYNNIVSRAGSLGWFFQKETYISDTSRQRGKNNTEFYVLEKTTGRQNKNRYDMKYDSMGKVSDQKGNKLNGAAICFETQYRSEEKNNVILLSATPFTDTPFQVMSVLGMANYNMLRDNGIKNSWDFFNNYVDEVYKFGIRHDGESGLFIDVDGYYNDKALSNLITNVAHVKITDEKIEANRPKKAIIPQNKIVKGESGVAQTTQMGDIFDELVDVNSRVSMTEAQNQFKDIISKYLKDENDQRAVKEIFPINEDRISGKSTEIVDKEVEELVTAKIEEAQDDVENADMVVTFLQSLHDKGNYAQHPRLKEAIDHITVKILGGTIEKPEEDDLQDTEVDLNQLSTKDRLTSKAIGCQGAQQALVISPYLVNLGNSAYTSPLLENLEPNPSKVFVESSPKFMFVIKAIQDTIRYQQEQLKGGEISKIGGQVIYFDRHKFGYGGKEYNAFDLLAEYIANNIEGISSEKTENGEYAEIGIIEGSTKDKDTINKKTGDILKRGKTHVKDDFNSGAIKVLIGSKAIKEGIDLQGNAHTMYICEAEFSPEVAMQLEGRIWRQKNPYNVVRIVYVLAMNTIDSFIYDKINRKVNMIKRMLELGVYEMNTTQFTMDTKEMIMQLEDDPDKLTLIDFQDKVVVLKNYLGTLAKKIDRLILVNRRYSYIEMAMASKLPHVNTLYNGIREFRDNEHKGKIKVQLTKVKSALAIQEMRSAEEGGLFKGNIKEWMELPENTGKYSVSEIEIEEAFKKDIENKVFKNPLPVLLTELTTDSLFIEIESAVTKVIKNLDLANSIEFIWRRASEEERQIIRDKKQKSIGEALFILFYDTVGSTDTYDYKDSLRDMFLEDKNAANIIETYQGYVKSQGKTIDDIDEVIDVFQKEYNSKSLILSNEAQFKANLREDWVKALAEREEKTDMSLDGLVKTFEASNKLLKIRKN